MVERMGKKTGRSSLFAQEAVSNSMTPAEQPRGAELRDRVIRDRHRSSDGGMISFGARVTAINRTMRRCKTNAVAGTCCCLIPVILFVIIVLAVIGAAVVWRGAMPNMFRWESAHHPSEAYRDGYEEGNRLGAAYATRGDPEPTGQNLDALALREADRLHVTRYRRHWIQGFRSGFARGFGSFSKQANLPVIRSAAHGSG